MRGNLLFCTLLLLRGPGLAAQGDSVAPGDRVRLVAPPVSQERLIGTVLSRRADTLVLHVPDAAAQVAVPLAAIERLEVSRGRHGHAFAGFAVGFLVGAAAEGVAYANCQGLLCPHRDGAGLAVTTGLLLGLPGLVIGALIRSEDWERVPLPRLSVGAGPGRRGVTVGLAVRF